MTALRTASTLVLRVVAIGWALATGAALLLLIPTGYLVGLTTWTEDGIVALYLGLQLTLALTAAITIGRRPLAATMALAMIGLLLGSAQALFLHGIAVHASDPLAWQHKAWRYLLPTTIATFGLALALPLLGWYLQRHRIQQPRSDCGAIAAAWQSDQ